MSGWYKQQRNLSQRAWFKDPDMVQLYVYLKERAFVADGQYQGIHIRRGSCPVTRSELMEVTGMTYQTLNRKLKKLIGFNEIIVRANNRFSVVTVCDYDSYTMQENLFGTTDGITNGTTGGTADGTTYNNIEYKNIDNLVRQAYKTERENSDLAFEIKKRYNKIFDGKLQPCIRLTLPTKIQVEECVRRFGLQSVDIVFNQVLSEPFSLGQNKTGFRASFQFIFEPKNFQQYLERAQMPKQKKKEEPQPKQKSVGVIKDTPHDQKQDRRAFILSWVDAESTNPSKRGQELLKACYDSGELQKLGIEWKPDNKTIEL